MNDELELGKKSYTEGNYRSASIILGQYLKNNPGDKEAYELYFKSVTENFTKKNYLIFDITFAFNHFENYLKLDNTSSYLIDDFKKHFKVVLEETITEVTKNFTATTITLDASSLFKFYQKFICEDDYFTNNYIEFENRIMKKDKTKTNFRISIKFLMFLLFVVIALVIVYFYYYFML